jgi:membrane protein
MTGRVYERGRRVVLALMHHDALTKASAMAFDAFMSLIPLLALAGWTLQVMHESGEILLAPLFATAPEQAKAIATGELFRLSEGGRAALPPISLFAFLYVTSSGISTAMSELELLFRVPPRPWWQRRLVAAALVIVSLVIVTGGVALSLALVRVAGNAGAIAVSLLAPTVALVIVVAAFFRVAVRLRGAAASWPGAVLTVVLWGASSSLFSTYVRTLSRYTTLYGGLAAVAILLFWLWLLSLALLVGGAVNAELAGQLEGSSSGGPPRLA